MIFPCEDDPVRPHFEESGEEFRDIELECEEEEARELCVPRDLGAPTESEVERQNVTHMPFRSWCAACVEEKARDEHHQKVEGQVDKEVPDIVFDMFLGVRGRGHCRHSSHSGSTDPNDLRPCGSEEGALPRAWSHGVDQGHRQSWVKRRSS